MKKLNNRPPADVASDRRSFLDGEHRRIGHMWPEDFEAYNHATFGRGWIADFSRYAGLSRDTVDLYRKGVLPIPKHIAQLVLHCRWYDMNKPMYIKDRIPPIHTPWLKDEDS